MSPENKGEELHLLLRLNFTRQVLNLRLDADMVRFCLGNFHLLKNASSVKNKWNDVAKNAEGSKY